jgi:hypothetical protein
MPAGKKTSPKKTRKWTRIQLEAKALPINSVMAPMHPSVSLENDLPFLGHPRAVVIVTTAARTDASNLPRSLSQLGVNGASFQQEVFDGVKHTGYMIGLDQIPAAPSTLLIEAVNLLQQARKTQDPTR